MDSSVTTISKKASAYFCWTSENSRQLWLSASAANAKQTRAEGCLRVPVDHKDLIQLGRAALNVSHLAHIFPFAQLASVARRNERERKRVRQINSAFSSLRQHVQHRSAKRKLSKAETLRCAIDYINHLRKVLDNKSKDSSTDEEIIDIDIKEDGEESSSTASTETSSHLESEDKFVQEYATYHQSNSKYDFEMSSLSTPNSADALISDAYQHQLNQHQSLATLNTKENPLEAYHHQTHQKRVFARDYQNDNGIDLQNYHYNINSNHNNINMGSKRSAFQAQTQSRLDCMNY